MAQEAAPLVNSSVAPLEVKESTEEQLAPATARSPSNALLRGNRIGLATTALTAGLLALLGAMSPVAVGWSRSRTHSAEVVEASQKPMGLFEDVTMIDDLEVVDPSEVTCVTQECECSWATGGPLGFCSTIGCPCPTRKCWDCCCKSLFPEEYAYAMGMRYFPPMPWWAYFLWALLVLFLVALVCGSCFIMVYYCLDLHKEKPLFGPKD